MTVKDLNKEEPRTFLRLSSEALNPKDKGYQEAKQELGGSSLDGIMFEGPGREAVIGHFSVTGSQWVRECPRSETPMSPRLTKQHALPSVLNAFSYLSIRGLT